MKPGFALTLSQDGITLLQRAIRGWLIVGEVPLDAPDLKAALARLRQTAEALAPGAVTTKLVLPEDQILYTTVRVPGRSEAQRRAQVAAALDGRTPYTLDEIVFDFRGKGPELQVAAVARETLTEAEHFAAEHGFNPVSFVAAPERGRFAGEPFFGLAAGAPDLGRPDATVERDSERINVVGHAVLPRSAPQKGPQPASATEPDRTTATKAIPDGLSPAPTPELSPGPPVPLTFSSSRTPAAETTPETAPDSASGATTGSTSRGKPPTLRRPAKTPPSPQRRITPRLPGLGPSAKAAMAPAAQAATETALEPASKPAPEPTPKTPFDPAARPGHAPSPATPPGTPPEAIPAPPPRTPPRKAPTARSGTAPAPVATPPSPSPGPTDAEAFARLGPTAARPRTSLMFLAAALIAALAAVAVWSALSLGRKPAPAAPVEAARAPTEAASAPAHSAPTPLSTSTPATAPETTAGASGPSLPAAPARPATLAPRTPAAPSLPGSGAPATALPSPSAPQPEAQDSALATPVDPAPYGTTYDLGPDGLVKPTPEGARTPSGTLVIAGRPPVVPPPRPGSVTTAPPETTSGAIPLTSLRPTGRPEAATTPEAAPEPVTGPVSRQAVAASPVPPERPADFAQSVAAALAASRAAAPPPTAQSVAPRVPTSASVAREATVKNALNLNQVSLLGVFGSASNRKALLRMPGGRIVRVGVGDRVASGKVVAIGEHEVHYVKNGRTLVLSMPKG